MDKIPDDQFDPRFRNTTKDLKRNVLMKNQFKQPEIEMEIRKQSKIKKHKHQKQTQKRKKWGKIKDIPIKDTNIKQMMTAPSTSADRRRTNNGKFIFREK